MYNEERKIQFLNSAYQGSSAGVQTFRIFAEYEERFGKDLALFHSTEMEMVLSDCFDETSVEAYHAILALKQYLRWCKHQAFQTTNAIDQLEINEVGKARATLFSSPFHLAHEMTRVFGDVEERWTSVLYHAFLWLIFAGMKDEDILNLHKDQFHLEWAAVISRDIRYPVCQEGIRAVYLAATLPAFCVPHGSGRLLMRKRISSQFMFSGVSSASIRRTAIHSQISRLAKSYHSNLSPRHVRLSGFFVRAHMREKIGIQPDFTEDAIMLASRESGEERRQSKQRFQRELKKDYAAWKQAFGYQ